MRTGWTSAAAVVLAVGLGGAAGRDEARGFAGISFNRDIRPILSDNCFKCHGPDEGTREADLRLDARDSAVADRGGYAAIAPGNAAASELIRRITAEDPADRMPPPETGHTLDARQIALLKAWVEQGAVYEPHWAFIPPRRPQVSAHAASARNAIDSFILARLADEGLAPGPESDRRRLIRRVTLDLTGLPPTPQEVEAFVADTSPDAYEKVVDRLLNTPRFGERMAVPWLDAARYGDTHGYLFDTERYMWRWRDWVIDAFNRNQPFDAFTTEQLAGDLLESPTQEQLIATGFNRNHIINNEAGAIADEYFVENIFDRVETTGTIWLGLTLQCARCHDHKYDPVSQREYYQLYAFFNNIAEVGLDGFNKNADPVIQAPTMDQRARAAAIDRRIALTHEEFAPLAAEIETAQAAWEKTIADDVQPLTEGLAAHWPFENAVDDAISGRKPEPQDGPPVYEEGVFGRALAMEGLRYLDAGQAGGFDRGDAFSISAWVYPTTQPGRRTILSKMQGADESFRGYALTLVEGSPALFLVNRFPDNLIQAQAGIRLEPHRWHHVLATYNGSGKADGVKLYIDGRPQEITLKIDTLAGSITVDEPLRIGSGQPVALFKGRIDDLRLFSRVVEPQEIPRLPGLSIHTLITPGPRTAEQHRRIREHYLENHAPSRWREPYQALAALREQREQIDREMPTSMIMRELDKPRETRMLVRGAYEKRGEKVEAGTPWVLPPMAGDLPVNRLGLARWLLKPDHPLTARVTVNRYWQMYFGIGLVRTAEDFGLQGEWPSHPELLDWLATEFIRTDWNVKNLHRLIVTSATYRQSSAASPQLIERDPENRLLARGPRMRLDGEFIRDQALAASGLLVGTIGGPSVKPYQPAELWREVAFDTTGQKLTAQIYVQDTADKLYRRTLYTFWKRTLPPPTLLTFDAPERERCTVRRDRTNTPLQALITMNDPTFVEASRKLAERSMHESGPSPAERISFAFRVLTGRTPVRRELLPLVEFFIEQQSRFAADASAARSLLAIGESPRDPSLDEADLAAYTVINNILLNLDEVLTRG